MHASLCIFGDESSKEDIKINQGWGGGVNQGSGALRCSGCKEGKPPFPCLTACDSGETCLQGRRRCDYLWAAVMWCSRSGGTAPPLPCSTSITGCLAATAAADARPSALTLYPGASGYSSNHLFNAPTRSLAHSLISTSASSLSFPFSQFPFLSLPWLLCVLCLLVGPPAAADSCVSRAQHEPITMRRGTCST